MSFERFKNLHLVQFGIDCEVYRQDMGQANLNLKPIIEKNNWDLLDGQFWFRKLQNHNYRELDGVHWNQLAHSQRLKNLILVLCIHNMN